MRENAEAQCPSGKSVCVPATGKVFTTEVTEGHEEARRRKTVSAARPWFHDGNLRVSPWFFVTSMVKVFLAVSVRADSLERH